MHKYRQLLCYVFVSQSETIGPSIIDTSYTIQYHLGIFFQEGD